MSIIGKGYFINSNSAVIHIVAPTGSTIIARNNAKSKTLSTAIGTSRLDRTWVSDYYLKIPSIYYGNWTIQGISALGENLTWGNDEEYLVVNNNEEYLTSCYFYAPILEYDDLEYISGEGSISFYGELSMGQSLIDIVARIGEYSNSVFNLTASDRSFYISASDLLRISTNSQTESPLYISNQNEKFFISILTPSTYSSSNPTGSLIGNNDYISSFVTSQGNKTIYSDPELTNPIKVLQNGESIEIIGYSPKVGMYPTYKIRYYDTSNTISTYIYGYMLGLSVASFQSLVDLYNKTTRSSTYDYLEFGCNIYGVSIYNRYFSESGLYMPCRDLNTGYYGFYYKENDMFIPINPITTMNYPIRTQRESHFEFTPTIINE